MFVDLLIVGGLSAVAAAGELISRYRDAPAAIFRAMSAWTYVTVNVAAGLAALGLIRAFDIEFGASGQGIRWMQVFVAAFGSLALFRSALFVVRVGDEDVSAGPAAFLQAFLSAADRGVDRKRAVDRARKAGQIMGTVDFEKASEALPASVMALMQNLSASEQEQIGGQITALTAASMPDPAKSLAMGLLLMNMSGAEVLREAVATLGAEISREA